MIRLAIRPIAFSTRLPIRASRRRPKRSWKKFATVSTRTNAIWPSNALWVAVGRNSLTNWVGLPWPCEKNFPAPLTARWRTLAWMRLAMNNMVQDTLDALLDRQKQAWLDGSRPSIG